MKPKLLTVATYMIALFSVNLAYGYHPFSPYAYCMGESFPCHNISSFGKTWTKHQ